MPGEPPKVIAFEDGRGIERRPNPAAAEYYASPEIQQAVGEHFIWVDRKLEAIETSTTKIAASEKNGERPKPFNPLSDELLKQVLTTAVEQLPSLTQPTTKTIEHETTTGRIFKRKHTTFEDVTEQQKVPGYTATAQDRDTGRRWRETIGGISRSQYGTKAADVPGVEEQVRHELAVVLTGTEPTWSERSGQQDGTKLPLLAVKLRDTGLGVEEINALSWDDVVKLVPEASTMFEDIEAGVAHQSAQAVYGELAKLEGQLREIAPAGCTTIARLYYSDELLGKMEAIQKHIAQLEASPAAMISSGSEPVASSDFLAEQRESIASFFDGKELADTLYIHGTPFAPRVIKSGALRPSPRMSSSEFTFNTERGAGD